MTIPFIMASILFLLIIFAVIFIKKSRDEAQQPETINEPYWWLAIAFIITVLLVVAGSIIMKELINKNVSPEITKGDSSDIFPWFIFIPIWLGASRKRGQPTPQQKKILTGIVIITIVAVLATMILWFSLS